MNMRPAKRTAATVVVVGDDPIERAALESMLTRRGFRVEAIGADADAVDCVRSTSAGVVVLGLEKRAQALDLIRRLRGRFEPMPLSPLPRILVAADGIDASVESFARKLGADALVRRPLSDRECLEAVSKLARQPALAAATSLHEAV